MDGSFSEPPEERTPDWPVSPQGHQSALCHPKGCSHSAPRKVLQLAESQRSRLLPRARPLLLSVPADQIPPVEMQSPASTAGCRPARSSCIPQGRAKRTFCANREGQIHLRIYNLTSSSVTLAPPLEISSFWVPTQGQTSCSSLCQTGALLRTGFKPGLA